MFEAIDQYPLPEQIHPREKIFQALGERLLNSDLKGNAYQNALKVMKKLCTLEPDGICLKTVQYVLVTSSTPEMFELKKEIIFLLEGLMKLGRPIEWKSKLIESPDLLNVPLTEMSEKHSPGGRTFLASFQPKGPILYRLE